MTDTNTELREAKWLPHNGGPCPVAPDTLVRPRYADEQRAEAEEFSFVRAYDLNWDEIAEYQIITPAPDPRDAEIARLTAEVEGLRDVADAAHGLSYGEDWNKGVAAKIHGYRRKLLIALAKLKGDDASPAAHAALRKETP